MNRNIKRNLLAFAGALLLAPLTSVGTEGPGWQDQDPAGPLAGARKNQYTWSPVRLGAGGFVTGFVTHPLDAGVRYCRTDVGNAYRWNGQEWLPMIVRSGSRGMPARLAAAPTGGGVESIAIDPADKRVVYVSFQGSRSHDVAALYPPPTGKVYRSADSGATFVGGNLYVQMDPNGPWRTFGERMRVDPHNGTVVYYGTLKQGLWRSLDGGATWTAVRGGPPRPAGNVLSVHFAAAEGTIKLGDTTVSRVLYATGANGSVHRSEDGGVKWKNISAGLSLDGKCGVSTMDSGGALYVVEDRSRKVWRYHNGQWTGLVVELDWNQMPFAVAIDPRDVNRIYAIGAGGALSRSLDGGRAWTPLGPELLFANAFGWLPQPVSWRSNAGLTFDRDGVLWIAQGNEGMLSCTPTDKETRNDRPKWTIDSRGIEELVSHDVIMPPGGKTYVAVEDATGMVLDDPRRFTARQIALQDQLISNGTGLAYCPNAPDYVAVVTADVFHTGSGRSYSGYTADGGKTWTRFAGSPADPDSGKPLNPAGSIAVGRRGDWGLGGDHLLWLPTGKQPTFYSTDGGKTWKPSTGFPLGSGYWIFALKQRLLAADPFTPDRFYFHGSWAGGFYVSTDGGKTWRKQEQAGLPAGAHHGQLAVNRAVKNDLWFVDGWEGASKHGLWHSTDGGRRFSKVEGIEYGITLCLGAGRAAAGDAPYTVYFYGKMAASPDWGVFSSTDAGDSWERISYYPAGIFDQPTCMAASWDSFATVIIGFAGNSFVMGTPAHGELRPTRLQEPR